MSGKALEGLKVVELASFVAGPYCAKLLADLGADVIKIEEPPAGDLARTRGPFPDDIPHPERSGLFLLLNTSKRGVTLDVGTATGRDIFKRLVAWADILVEDHAPQQMEERGLTYQDLKAENPGLIMTSISPFGQSGPYRDFKAYPLNTFHSGGEPCIMLHGTSSPGRAPINGPAFMGECDCGLGAAIATLGALYWRGTSGRGQHIDASKQDMLISLERLENVLYHNRKKDETRALIDAAAKGAGMVGGLLRCQDGYVVLAAMQDNQWRGLVDLMGDPEWARDERFQGEDSRTLHAREATARVQEWMEHRTKEEVFRGGQARGVPVGAVQSPQDLVHSPQLRARGFFAEVDHPQAGRFEYPAAPYVFSETPWAATRPAPLLGEHNEEVYRGLLGYRAIDLVKMRVAGII